jgi:ATP-dependent protease Clp ATPase subunit
MVLQMAGRCSFCGKDRREVFGIAGVVGSAARICDECIGLCFEILAEKKEAQQKETRTPPEPDPAQLVEQSRVSRLIDEALAAIAKRPIASELQALLSGARQLPPPEFRPFHCSFCDRAKQDVRKLIAGPRVFICDDCTGDAAGLLSASGWRFDAG